MGLPSPGVNRVVHSVTKYVCAIFYCMNILRIAVGDKAEEDCANGEEEGGTEVEEEGPSSGLASGAGTNKMRM